MELKNCAFVLFVKDAKIARSFYEDFLGLKVTADFGGTNIVFQEGFVLWQIMDENIISQTLGSEKITRSNQTSRFELCFETEDLDEIYKTLKDNKTKFLHEINVELWGQQIGRAHV